MATGLLVGATFAPVFKARAIKQNIVRYELQKHQNDSKTNTVDSHSASSKSSSSSPGDLPKEDNPEVAKVLQFLANLHITGSSSINGVLSYTFNGAAIDSYYSSRDLVTMGFTVIPLGDCSARIALNTVESTV